MSRMVDRSLAMSLGLVLNTPTASKPARGDALLCTLDALVESQQTGGAIGQRDLTAATGEFREHLALHHGRAHQILAEEQFASALRGIAVGANNDHTFCGRAPDRRDPGVRLQRDYRNRPVAAGNKLAELRDLGDGVAVRHAGPQHLHTHLGAGVLRPDLRRREIRVRGIVAGEGDPERLAEVGLRPFDPRLRRGLGQCARRVGARRDQPRRRTCGDRGHEARLSFCCIVVSFPSSGPRFMRGAC